MESATFSSLGRVLDAREAEQGKRGEGKKRLLLLAKLAFFFPRCQIVLFSRQKLAGPTYIC